MPLNKSVRGLTDLLGLYQGGQVVLEPSPWVAPAYDVLPFLAPAELTYNNNVAGAGPYAVKVTVPENERWLVNSISCWADLPAANDEIVCYPYFNPGTAGGTYVPYAIGTMPGRFTKGVASSQNMVADGVTFENHFIADPGFDVGYYISKQLTLGNITFEIAVSFHRIRL